MTILLITITYYHISVNIFSDKDIIIKVLHHIPERKSSTPLKKGKIWSCHSLQALFGQILGMY